MQPFAQQRERLRNFIGLRHGHDHPKALTGSPQDLQHDVEPVASVRTKVSPLRLRHLSRADSEIGVSSSARSLDAAWQHQLDMVASHVAPLPSGPSPATVASPLPGPAPAPAAEGGEPLPSQGFSGRLVAHADTVTQTSDWHVEYGPHAPRKTFQEMCAEYPENTWCKYKGYHKKDPDVGIKDNKSSTGHHSGMGYGLAFLGVVLLIVLVASFRAK